MKKKSLKPFISFLFLVLLFPLAVFPQNDPCHLRASATVRPSMCQADGEITVMLDTAGSRLDNIRYSLIPGITHSTGNVITDVGAGTYKVVVEALCNTGISGPGNFINVSDTIHDVVVTSGYQTPTVGILQGNFTISRPYGNVPSFSCAPTGKIQLKIEKGTFPFFVEIVKDQQYMRTDTFYTHMYNGTSLNNYDYKDYYTVGNLGAGNYEFRITDGCGYNLPVMSSTVEYIDNTYSSSAMNIYHGSDNPTDSNILRFSLLYSLESYMNYYYAYSHMHGMEDWWEYAVSIDGGVYTPWKDMPDSGIVRDTLTSISNYCELYGKTVTVKVRAKICESTEYSRTFTINSPLNKYVYKEYGTSLDSTVTIPAQYTSCNYTTQKTIKYNFKNSYNYYKHYNLSGNINSSSADFYYTTPLSIEIRDNDQDTLIHTNTVNTLTWNEYVYNLPGLDGVNVSFTVKDRNGCIIASETVLISTEPSVTETGGVTNSYTWGNNFSGGNHCQTSIKSIYLYRSNTIATDPRYLFDSTVVKLVQSPDGNKYNFTAIYDQEANHWTIIKDDPRNTSDTYGNGAYIYMNALDLPSGNYVFQVTDQCNTYNYTVAPDFPGVLSISEKPSYTFTQECSYLEVVPVAGQIQLDGSNTGTKFKIISGPTGGYPPGAVGKNSPLRLSMRGNYTIRMYPDQGERNTCAVIDTVIFYSGGSVEIDYFHAYVCNSGDPTANIKIRGKNGNRPYLYTIFSEKDEEGIIVAQDTIGEFPNIPALEGQEISVRVEDACGASFYTNITITNLELARKAWFADGSQNGGACQGDGVMMYGLSLGNVTYQWRGPNGFYAESQNADLWIDRSTMASGAYYLEILGSHCSSITDSLSFYVIIAPSVSIKEDVSLCPGEEYQVELTAHGTGDITYAIAQEENSVISTTVFRNRRDGEVDRLTVRPLSKMHIWVAEVMDSLCHYQIPEDSIIITMKPSSTSCDLTVSSAMECYDNDAIITAGSSLSYPYIVNWYQDENLSLLYYSDTIRNAGDTPSKLELDHLRNDMTFYITVKNDSYCEYRPGTSSGYVWMNNGTTQLNCGESLRFYDSGGPQNNYSYLEDYIHTFISSDGLPLTIRFDEFYTENSNVDKMYIYDGGSTSSPLLALDLGGDLNANLPGPYTSTGDSLTVLFISNGTLTFSGWSATVSVENDPVKASVKIYPYYENIFRDTVCQNNISYNPVITDHFTGIDISVPGIYQWSDTLNTVNGCDSIISLNLTINPTYEQEFHGSICRGEIYTDHGFTVNTIDSAAGTYVYRYQYSSLTNCDSTRILHLTINQSSSLPISSFDTVYACGTTFMYGDTLFEESGTKEVTIKNSYGCDSLYIMATVYLNHPDIATYHFTISCHDTTLMIPNGLQETILEIPNPTWDHHLYNLTHGDSMISLDNDAPFNVRAGIYDILWTATDPCGNSASCTQRITVLNQSCTDATDYEGNIYEGILIGSQCWLRSNLKSLHYADGRPIPETRGYYADLYPDTVWNISTFGRLYNWYAAVDSARPPGRAANIQGICPDGWSMPTVEDFRILMEYGAPALKSADYWLKNPGNNNTGFTALPAGYYNAVTNSFYYLMGNTYFWTTEAVSAQSAYYFELSYDCEELLEKRGSKNQGYSIRCIKK